MNGELLAKVGQALYGDQWRANLARSLNVDGRRIPQWETGRRPIPAGVVNDLILLLQNNALEINTLLIDLKKIQNHIKELTSIE